jgi:hypothetical protein
MGVVADVQVILNDTGVFWPTQTVLDAVNEAQFWVYAETKYAITSSTLVLTSNADVVALPTSILIPKWIEGTGTGTTVERIHITTQRSLESYSRLWKGAALGAPAHVSVWDATHLRIFPRPDATYTYTLFGTGFPAEITATEAIAGPTAIQKAAQCYTVALLFEATRPDLADVYMGQAQELTLAYKKRLRNQQSHNIRTLHPATTKYEVRQSGVISPRNCLKDYIG